MTTLKPASSSLSHYFSRVRGNISPGSHRLQRLVTPWLEQGILEIPTILVGGTNGKGSVCALLESALRAAGLQTGLATSPHLVTPRERMRLNGIPVGEELLAALLTKIVDAQQTHLPDATFFEITTAATLLLFFQSHIDVAVIEVGLGGRFDATNALAPLVSALTSVGLEHVQQLGATERAIAAHKSYISRRHRPLILGPLTAEAHEGVANTLAITGAHAVNASAPLPEDFEKSLAESLKSKGAWVENSATNARIAAMILAHWRQESGQTVSGAALQRGFQTAFWPGRFDIRTLPNGDEIIFDAMHNSAGFIFFRQQWHQRQGIGAKAIVVYGSLADKDWPLIVPQLGQLASHVIFTQVESERAVPAQDLASLAQNAGYSLDVIPALANALTAARTQGQPILVLGSIALVGAAMAALDIEPL